MTTTAVDKQMHLINYQTEDVFIYLGLSIEYTAVSWKTNQMTVTLYY